MQVTWKTSCARIQLKKLRRGKLLDLEPERIEACTAVGW